MSILARLAARIPVRVALNLYDLEAISRAQAATATRRRHDPDAERAARKISQARDRKRAQVRKLAAR